MSKYLFKGLDEAADAGPGPTLWFQSPTSFKNVAAQIVTSTSGGAADFGVKIEITLNGTDFRSIGTIGHGTFGSASGGYAILNTVLAPVGLIMGFRLNLLSIASGNIPLLLAIEENV